MTAVLMTGMTAQTHAQTSQTKTGSEVETALPTVEEDDVLTLPPSNSELDKVNREMKELLRTLTSCVGLDNRMGRLRCYDDLSVDLGLMEDPRNKEEREKLATYGFWSVYIERDQLGVDTFYMVLEPYNRLRMSTLSVNVPTFNIRCRQGTTDAYIDWKTKLNPRPQTQKEHSLSYRVDNDKERFERWQLSFDGLAAFSPYPVDFVKYLRGKRLLLMRITPSGGSLETLSFELTGLEQALAMMVDRCY